MSRDDADEVPLVSVFVETDIRVPMEVLWNHTQDPTLHERWDLRFSSIDYTSGADGEPQRFRYTTRLGFGVAISGEGESVGEKDLPDGARTSALRFWTESPVSIIREGRGYWKFEPTADGVRFATSFDYESRYGRPGSWFDRFVFRPMFGWATAWSFDRLRLWVEDEIAPAISLRAAFIHGIARLALVATFLYHGLVPKLLLDDADERLLLTAAGVPSDVLGPALIALGIAEIGLALVLLLASRRTWPLVVVFALAIGATIGIAVTAPLYLGAAFNPLTLNLGVLALAVIDWLVLPLAPSAGRCRRRPSRASA